jgi:dihydropyrimidine dehydrogenase (NAD+) subunit PreT
VTRETGQTANPKYFAGGDCVSGGREVVDAVADGKRAARGIIQSISA